MLRRSISIDRVPVHIKKSYIYYLHTTICSSTSSCTKVGKQVEYHRSICWSQETYFLTERLIITHKTYFKNIETIPALNATKPNAIKNIATIKSDQVGISTSDTITSLATVVGVDVDCAALSLAVVDP